VGQQPAAAELLAQQHMLPAELQLGMQLRQAGQQPQPPPPALGAQPLQVGQQPAAAELLAQQHMLPAELQLGMQLRPVGQQPQPPPPYQTNFLHPDLMMAQRAGVGSVRHAMYSVPQRTAYHESGFHPPVSLSRLQYDHTAFTAPFDRQHPNVAAYPPALAMAVPPSMDSGVPRLGAFQDISAPTVEEIVAKAASQIATQFAAQLASALLQAPSGGAAVAAVVGAQLKAAAQSASTTMPTAAAAPTSPSKRTLAAISAFRSVRHLYDTWCELTGEQQRAVPKQRRCEVVAMIDEIHKRAVAAGSVSCAIDQMDSEREADNSHCSMPAYVRKVVQGRAKPRSEKRKAESVS
jgi:hypothetical protein